MVEPWEIELEAKQRKERRKAQQARYDQAAFAALTGLLSRDNKRSLNTDHTVDLAVEIADKLIHKLDQAANKAAFETSKAKAARDASKAEHIAARAAAPTTD